MKPTFENIAVAAAVIQQFARDTKGTASPNRTEAAVWSVWSALTGDGEPEQAFNEAIRKARQAAPKEGGERGDQKTEDKPKEDSEKTAEISKSKKAEDKPKEDSKKTAKISKRKKADTEQKTADKK